MNTYPLFMVRNLTFSSKQSYLENQASLVSTALSGLEVSDADSVTQVLRLLDVEGMNRILVVSRDGTVLFDTSRSAHEDTMKDWGCEKGLSGNVAFFCRFSEGAYHSSAAMPFYIGDQLAGSVYLYEKDPTQGATLLALQSDIRLASIVICAVSLLFSIVFSTTITRRIRMVLRAIRVVREGEYSYRLQIDGNDELAVLGNEFNSLTAYLQSNEEMRRRFVSDASHELKTPLASIRLLSDSILQNPDVDAETVLEFMEDIGSETERLARTTEKLLNLTRHDNKIQDELYRLSISTAAEGAIHILKPIAANANVTLYCDLGGDAYILATQDEIYQIVINLVENAIKYNVPGGSVWVHTQRRGDLVELQVSDTGIGIPEAALPNIFDRFFRVDKARSRETGGSGLGLSIVRAIAQERGGDVTVKPREEGGTCFTVTLPYCTSDVGVKRESEENS